VPRFEERLVGDGDSVEIGGTAAQLSLAVISTDDYDEHKIQGPAENPDDF
jgi:hypothetical protein